MKTTSQTIVFPALLLGLVLTVGCLPQVSRYRYLSFENLPGSHIESTAAVEVENLVFGSTIPVEYLLVRKGYKLRVSINPRSYFPNARIALVDSPGIRLVPRPARGARTDRPRPCGSYDAGEKPGYSFEFSWVICGDKANPEELVVAFDVLGDNLGIEKEALRFALVKDGVYWLRDSL